MLVPGVRGDAEEELPPADTFCGTGGLIVPWVPGRGVMVNCPAVSASKVAPMVWSLCTLVNS